MLITTAHQRCLTSLAASDKRIPEWLSIICSLQNWGLHVWCEVQSLVSQKLSALVHAWCAGKQKSPAAWQMSAWAARLHSNMHHWLSPLAAWKLHQCTSAWRHRYTETCLSEASEGRQWAESASDWNMVSNQRSFNDQAIDQWQYCFNALS